MMKVTSPTNDACCKKWPKLLNVLLKLIYHHHSGLCPPLHVVGAKFEMTLKVWAVWPKCCILCVATIYDTSLLLWPWSESLPFGWCKVSYLQRKKVDGAKFKVTQSVRGGLVGGRHKMWRQKPEEASSRGAPTQLFLTLEHWIYPTCTLHHQIYLLSDGRVGKMWSLLVSQLCHFLLMVRNPNFGDKKVPYFNVSWQKVPLGDLVSKRHPDP